MDVVLWIAGVAVAVALPGLSARRRGPWPARLWALATLAALWIVALDWPISERHALPREVDLVTTGPSPVAALDSLRAAVEATPGGEFRLHRAAVGAADLSELLTVAALRAGPREIALVWTDPVVAGAASPLAGSAAVETFTAAAPAVIEPEWFELRTLAALEVGRPAELELRYLHSAPPPDGLTGSLELRDAAGVVVGAVDFTGAELDRPLGLEFALDAGGSYRLRLQVDAGSSQVLATGVVEVATPAPVVVVGASAEVLMQALAVQGILGVALPTLPVQLDADVYVLLDALNPEQQARVAEFVDAGGGVLLVGRSGGGSLPLAGEALDRLSPVARAPDPPQPESDAEPGPGLGPEQPDDASPEPSSTEPPDQPPASDPSPDLAQGDVSSATPPQGEAREVERRNVALVLVIDRSGSMATRVDYDKTRMDYAKRAAFETARRLAEVDELAIVTFGDGARVERRLGPTPSEAELREVLRSVRSKREPTEIEYGLERAEKELQRSSLAVRHVVVVTDGEFVRTTMVRPRVLVTHMAKEGITTSVVHIGFGGDSWTEAQVLAREIAQRGRGQYHAVEDPARVPALVLAEVQRVRGPGPPAAGQTGAAGVDRSDVESPEPPAAPELDSPAAPDPVLPDPDPNPDPPVTPSLEVRAISDSALLRPEPVAGFPPVAGICRVSARPHTRVLLVAGRQGIPLLAFANRGLGRVGAWTADLLGDWGAGWRADPVFPGRFATWVQYLRPARTPAVAGDLLSERQLAPAAPRAIDRAALAELAPGGLLDLADYRMPPERWEQVERGSAQEWAWCAIASIFCLALVEFLARRWS